MTGLSVRNASVAEPDYATVAVCITAKHQPNKCETDKSTPNCFDVRVSVDASQQEEGMRQMHMKPVLFADYPVIGSDAVN